MSHHLPPIRPGESAGYVSVNATPPSPEKAVETKVSAISAERMKPGTLLPQKEVSVIWEESFAKWQKKNPHGTKDQFAEELLKSFWQEFEATQDKDIVTEYQGKDFLAAEEKFIESLFLEFGKNLPNEILYFATNVYLGGQDSRQIGNGFWGTIVRSPEKEGRDQKIRIYNSNVGGKILGSGGANVVQKIHGISFVERNGEVSTKGIREYASRSRSAPKTLDEIEAPTGQNYAEQGNFTLIEAHRVARETVSSGKELPNGVTLDEKGRIEGLVKPLVPGDSSKAYMKLYKGGSLDKWIETHSPSPQAILKAFAPSMHGFAAIIAYRIMQRDLKPPNLMVDIDPVTKTVKSKVGDFDGSFTAQPLTSDMTAMEVLDELFDYRLGPSGISPGYNLYSDYQYISLVGQKSDELAVELEEALALLEEAQIQGISTRAEEVKIEELKLELIKLRNNALMLVEKMQVFQMGLSLFEALSMPIKAIERQPGVLPLVAKKIDDEKIDTLLTKLNLPVEQAEKLKIFFQKTIGQDPLDRVTGREAFKLFHELELLL